MVGADLRAKITTLFDVHVTKWLTGWLQRLLNKAGSLQLGKDVTYVFIKRRSKFEEVKRRERGRLINGNLIQWCTQCLVPMCKE